MPLYCSFEQCARPWLACRMENGRAVWSLRGSYKLLCKWLWQVARRRGRACSLSLETQRVSPGKVPSRRLEKPKLPIPPFSAHFSLLTHVCCLIWVTVQTFSQEAIPGPRLFTTAPGVCSRGTEATFHLEPPGQIRTQWTTPSTPGSEACALDCCVLGGTASRTQGPFFPGSQWLRSCGAADQKKDVQNTVQGGAGGAGEEGSLFVPLSGLPAGSWLYILVLLRQTRFWHCACPVWQEGAF